MEAQHPRPTASFVAHNPAELKLPSVPKTDVNHTHAVAELTLPDLKTVLSPGFQEASLLHDVRSSTKSPTSVRSLPRIEPAPLYSTSNGEPRGLETAAVASPSELGSAMSVDNEGSVGSVKSPSVSMDDPDVRAAAEALSGLGNPGFIPTPSAAQSLTSSPRKIKHPRSAHHEEKPLFQIFAKAHPWASGAINGSLTAYSTTKNYSPRFVQYGVKLIEDKVALPVATTVGTVGRVTGVESGIRWYYGGHTRRPSDLEEGRPNKRRLTEEDADHWAGYRSETQDHGNEQLPAYGSSKPPSYREDGSPATTERASHTDQNQSWPSQVLVMTSGLGVALSTTSQNSLKFCLSFLARQAEHITTVMNALKLVLQQYDEARDVYHQNRNTSMEKGERPKTPDNDDAARRLAEIIRTHSEDIWKTLQGVVTSVSSYAGGALPENARHFVKTQLMSLPHRWRFVSERQTGDSETSRSAHRMVAFATEGLDMIAQVSQTMGLTLQSAEQWIDMVGRRRAEGHSGVERKDYDITDAPARTGDAEKQ